MLALVLAQSAPPPISQEWQGNLISFSILAYIALSIWEKLKRKPALEETFVKIPEFNAVKQNIAGCDERVKIELRELEERTEKKIDALDRRREAGEKAGSEALHRHMGEMKTFISDRIAENRENNTERFGELKGQMASFQTSLQGLSNDLMHQVGRLEGEMRATTRARGAHNIDE